MGNTGNSAFVLHALRMKLEAQVGGRIDFPLLASAQKAARHYSRRLSRHGPKRAVRDLEHLFQAVNLLETELAERDMPGTEHCIRILNAIRPEQPKLLDIAQ